MLLATRRSVSTNRYFIASMDVVRHWLQDAYLTRMDIVRYWLQDVQCRQAGTWPEWTQYVTDCETFSVDRRALG